MVIDPAPKANDAEAPPPEPPKALSAQEQMERFEEDLKESDWGHQPC